MLFRNCAIGSPQASFGNARAGNARADHVLHVMDETRVALTARS